MKLYYFNYGDIPCYCIENPSKSFNRALPKKYIVLSIEKNQVYNVDNLNELVIPCNKISYMFVNEKPMNKKLSKTINEYRSSYQRDMDDKLRVYPMDLSNYITEKNQNVVIKFYPKKTTTEPRFLNDIVICSNIEFLLTLNFKKTFENVLDMIFKKHYKPLKNTEEWLLEFLRVCPVSSYYSQVRYPNIIEDSMFKKPLKPKLSDFVIGYCIREKDIHKEVQLIKNLEHDLSDFNKDVKIYNNYNNILSKLIPELKKQKIKFKQFDTYIELNASDFYKLKNMKYSLLDYLK